MKNEQTINNKRNKIDKGSNSKFNKSVFFEDNFDYPQYTNYYWHKQCDTYSHEYNYYKDLGEANRRGHCKQSNGTVKFTTMAFDKRGDWDLRDAKVGEDADKTYAKKGGGEFTQPYELPNTDNNKRFNELRTAKIDDGIITEKGWDYTGESYLAEGNIVQFHYRFRINDISMIDADLSTGVYIFQQHTHKKGNCYDDTFTYKDSSDVKHNHDEMAPTAGLYFVKSGSEYFFKFRTKTRDHPYYRRNGPTSECVDKSKPICSISLWEQKFNPVTDIGKWYEMIVEMKVAKQVKKITGCKVPWKEIKKKNKKSYERCRPSSGYLSLIVNGKRVKGNGTGSEKLPWVMGQRKFHGVTTQHNKCPSYPKFGQYALGYDYDEAATLSQSQLESKKIEVEFDYFKIIGVSD